MSGCDIDFYVFVLLVLKKDLICEMVLSGYLAHRVWSQVDFELPNLYCSSGFFSELGLVTGIGTVGNESIKIYLIYVSEVC